MKNLRLIMAAIVTCFAMAFAATPAQAQATRTWVSGVGDDVNPCSRTAPCKTFAGAISKTATNGEINCLESAGFGAVTITKSIIIDCHSEHGGILSLNVTGVIVNGAGAVVTLRGLVINGAGGTTGNGIRILQAAAVNIDDCIIENFAGTTSNGRGVTIETSTANVRVTIQNSRFYNLNFVGIHSVPTAGNVLLSIDNVQLSRGGSTHIDIRQLTTATINRTSATNSPLGAGLTLELSTALATVSNSNFSENAIGILNGNGGAPTTRLFNSVISNNTSAGLSITAGQIISSGNNIIRGNSGNEAPSSDVGTD
jgi:hypothetical protein